MAEELNPKESLLLAALLSGQTVRAAAAQIGLSEREAYRLSGSPSFKAALREVANDTVRAAVRRLDGLLGLAFQTLERAMVSSPPSVQVRAAEIIVTHRRAMLETSLETEPIPSEQFFASLGLEGILD